MTVLSRIAVDLSHGRPDASWCMDVPAVKQIVRTGLELAGEVTVIVGDNGSGKSTVLEAVAQAWRRRLPSAVQNWGPDPSDEDTDLYRFLDFQVSSPVPAGGCFLRAESMHSLFGRSDDDLRGTAAFAAGLNELSHGEGFLRFLDSRTTERGLFILDEPEAALSFSSCLRLVSTVQLLVENGSQVLLATHSPVLAAFPDAEILLFDESGISRAVWDELDMVEHWRAFLDRPELYLRHLLGE